MTEQVTFNGVHPSEVSLPAIRKAINLLRTLPANVIDHIIHHMSDEQIGTLFKNQATKHSDFESSKDVLYGLPVLKKSYVPLGEMWMMDKDGHVISKFSFN